MQLRISWDGGEAVATLDDTPTARKLMAALPFSSRASTWGAEVYFETPVSADIEQDARQVVEAGTVCFWVQGRSLAIPFGPTPISEGGECRLVTNVNVLGRLEGDPSVLASVREGDTVHMSAEQEAS